MFPYTEGAPLLDDLGAIPVVAEVITDRSSIKAPELDVSLKMGLACF
jgi:hypothetical protein